MTDVRVDQALPGAFADTASASATAVVDVNPARDAVPRAIRWGASAAALLLAASATAAVLAVQHDNRVQAEQAARRQVLADVSTSLPSALGYDYQHLDRDLSRAVAGLTPRFATDYRKLFRTTIAPTATKYRGVVTAEVVGSGIESADRRHAQVLAFVDQTTTTRILPAPRVDSSRVRVKLIRVGGHWRIDAIDPL